jgi:hypothetical protein
MKIENGVLSRAAHDDVAARISWAISESSHPPSGNPRRSVTNGRRPVNEAKCKRPLNAALDLYQR